MNTRTFFFGLFVAFGLPWLLLVGLPYGSLKALEPRVLDEDGLEIFPPPSRGLILHGHRVYMAQGCYQCHTQVIRPTYAGPDRWRFSGETPRETHPLDFLHIGPIAPIGLQRIGPDLANLGFRTEDASQLFVRLYDPRAIHSWSVMPSFSHLFDKRRVQGQRSANALPLDTVPDGWEVVPTFEAQALVTYLMSLRKDGPTDPSEIEN